MCISLHESPYLQHSNAPVFSSPLPCGLETREADKGHGGGDGQRSDVLQQDPGQTQRADTHLDQGRHDDSPLDLTEEQRQKKGLMNKEPERGAVFNQEHPKNPVFSLAA